MVRDAVVPKEGSVIVSRKASLDKVVQGFVFFDCLVFLSIAIWFRNHRKRILVFAKGSTAGAIVQNAEPSLARLHAQHKSWKVYEPDIQQTFNRSDVHSLVVVGAQKA